VVSPECDPEGNDGQGSDSLGPCEAADGYFQCGYPRRYATLSRKTFPGWDGGSSALAEGSNASALRKEIDHNRALAPASGGRGLPLLLVALNLGCSLRLESSEEHLPTSIAEVLRLRAMSRPLCDRAARRFAQDDGFVGGEKTIG
jgi:hypothetical protein